MPFIRPMCSPSLAVGSGQLTRLELIARKSRNELTRETAYCPPPTAHRSLALRHHNRRVIPISPLAPGAEVVADARVAEHREDQICVGRAIAAAAEGDDLLVRRDPVLREEGAEFVGVAHPTLVIEVIGPF